ncbi:unnamed protein product [Diatraea saccharalis]|uniref:Uncharacterized protein n=1 Tax=Diatraea saccharalis TaxID=40085 RepID=A0A9N9N0C6_9NEOP|nr:unnamed protein product [Diatraea saccharalis]
MTVRCPSDSRCVITRECTEARGHQVVSNQSQSERRLISAGPRVYHALSHPWRRRPITAHITQIEETSPQHLTPIIKLGACTYLPFCGPTFPSLKEELALRSLSGICPLSMPSGAMHCAATHQAKKKTFPRVISSRGKSFLKRNIQIKSPLWRCPVQQKTAAYRSNANRIRMLRRHPPGGAPGHHRRTPPPGRRCGPIAPEQIANVMKAVLNINNK